jgi:tetratricopeptide (TPR) repeat protein
LPAYHQKKKSGVSDAVVIWYSAALEILYVRGRIAVHQLLLLIGFLLAMSCEAFADAAADCTQDQDQDLRIRSCTLIVDGQAKGNKDGAYNNRGTAYWSKGDYGRAIADYNRAIELNPKLAKAYTNRGNAHHGKGDYDRAIADYNRGIELDPNYDTAYNGRGNAYTGKSEYDRAIADYNRAIELNPKYAVAYNSRGWAYYKKGDYDRAIADLNRAVELNPEFALAYRNRGYVYRHKGDYTRAMADYGRAIEIKPDYSGAHLYRARAYLQDGKTDQAFADISKALQLDANDPENFVARAQIYEAKGLRELAVADYRDALLRPAKSSTEKEAHEDAQRRLVALTTQPAPAQTVSAATASAPPSPAQAAAPSRRVALVIGNSDYAAVGRLVNPANDARVIAAALRRTGFAEVIERYDLNLSAMIGALREFGGRTLDADWAMVYYAGHGIEMNGVPYLIPIDAKLLRDIDVPDEAVPLERVLSRVETARKLKLVVLDACRNNPFTARMARTASRSRSIGRGLPQLEPEGSVLVAYSAKHGTTAQDGSGANSPFAKALAAHLEEPGLEINFLFRRVRDRVLAETDGLQEPFLYGSLSAEPLYFARQ